MHVKSQLCSVAVALHWTVVCVEYIHAYMYDACNDKIAIKSARHNYFIHVCAVAIIVTLLSFVLLPLRTDENTIEK